MSENMVVLEVVRGCLGMPALLYVIIGVGRFVIHTRNDTVRGIVRATQNHTEGLPLL